jgi:hypothetical protein
MAQGFPHKRDSKPYLIFYIANLVLLIYRVIPRIVGFSGLITEFMVIGISRCFGAWCSVQSATQRMYALVLHRCRSEFSR